MKLIEQLSCGESLIRGQHVQVVITKDEKGHVVTVKKPTPEDIKRLFVKGGE